MSMTNEAAVGLDLSPDDSLDVRGLSCPLPILKTKERLAAMASGEVLEILATDTDSAAHIPAFCKKVGHELLDIVEEGGLLTFYIKKV